MAAAVAMLAAPSALPPATSALHLVERRLARRYAGDAIVDALGLVAIIRGRGNADACEHACQTDRLQF